MGTANVAALEKEVLIQEPNVDMSGGEYTAAGTVIGIGDGLLKFIVSVLNFTIHPFSDANFTVTTSNSFIDLL